MGRRMEEPGRLTVVFALHDATGRYWLNTAVALASVLEHARRPVAVHLLHDATLSDLARARLTEIAARAGAPIAFRAAAPPAEAFAAPALATFSPATLFRLQIPALFAGEPLVVYLDSDLVANGLDVGELADAAPADAPISAVLDPWLGLYRKPREDMARLGLDHRAYVNAGVLALRPGLIGADLTAEFAAFIEAHPDVGHLDQDFLNWRFKGRIHLLDERFNYQVGPQGGRMFQPLGAYRGRLLHYVGKVKPVDGPLAPGVIPFLLHAGQVDEIRSGGLYTPVRYLTPMAGNPHALSALKFDGTA